MLDIINRILIFAYHCFKWSIIASIVVAFGISRQCNDQVKEIAEIATPDKSK